MLGVGIPAPVGSRPHAVGMAVLGVGIPAPVGSRPRAVGTAVLGVGIPAPAVHKSVPSARVPRGAAFAAAADEELASAGRVQGLEVLLNAR